MSNNIESRNKTSDNYTPAPYEYAAIYARKSTKLENNSIPSQIEIAKRKIEENNLFLYDIYYDEESATKYHPLHRQGFKKLLYDAEMNKFKTVIVYRRDRLARRVENLLEIKQKFKELGIKIIYSNEGEFQPNDSYLSNFIENIIISVDDLEPSILSERIISGMYEKKLRKEYSKKACYGYKRIQTNNDEWIYIHDKDENKVNDNYTDKDKSIIIEEIFNLFLKLDNNKSIYAEIAEHINKKFHISDNEKIAKQFIKSRIPNPIYAGLMRLDSKIGVLSSIYEDENGNFKINDTNFIKCKNVKEIIKPQTWYKALLKYNSLNSERNTIIDDTNSYLFKGLIYCKECNKPLHLIDETYKCINECTAINKIDLENTLLIKIFKDILKSDNIKKYHEKELNKYQLEIQNIETELYKNKLSQNDIINNTLKNYPSKSNLHLNELLNSIKKEDKINGNYKSEKNNCDLREEAIKFLLTSKEINSLYESKNISDLISKFRKDVNYSNILLSNIIKKIRIKAVKKVDLYDKNNRQIEYKSAE